MTEHEHILSAVWASLASGWHVGCKCGWISEGYNTSKAARDSGALHLDPPPPTGWAVWRVSDSDPLPWTFPDKKGALEHVGAVKTKRLTPGLYRTPAGDLVYRAEQSAEAALAVVSA